VAVIPFNAPHSVLDDLFAGINGLLFTGGSLNLQPTSFFFQQAAYLFDKAVAANDAGDVFPIWGSCQGFQLMNLLAARPKNASDVLKCGIYDSENLPLALDFTDAAPTSKLFGPAALIPAIPDGQSMHPTIYEAFGDRSRNITMNLHQCGVSPDDFNANPVLPGFYSVLSTNQDRNGRAFVSTVEGIKYPFWASQWHAERMQYEWDLPERLPHDVTSIAAASYVSQRWMIQARLSSHRFPSEDVAASTLIYNYTPTYDGMSLTDTYPDQLIYEFNFVFPQSE
jgi:gamma-glutamyl hydrolase